MIEVLPAGSHLAVNGGLAYVYLPESFEAQAPSLYAAIEKHPRLLAAIASVGPRAATDSPRSGDLTIILRPDHYFGNTGVGSHHGSIYADDLSVPLLMAMPGAPAGHVSKSVSNTQVARTIADYIGFAMDSAAPALPVPKRVRTTVSVAP